MSLRLRAATLAVAAATTVGGGLVAQTVLAGDAGAVTVTVTKVRLNAGHLHVEGTATPGESFVSVESTTSAVGTRAKGNGRYTADATGFTAPDCYLTIRDFGSPTLTVAIPHCTRSGRPVTKPAPPTGSCVITPQSTPAKLHVGTESVFWMYATGCDPSSPLTFTLVAGYIPTGMTVGGFQDSTSGNLIGTPSVPGTYRFTMEATDASGQTDQENFVVRVV